MADTLIEAMKAAGARAGDLWKIARPDVPPEQAVAELRAAYPDAFAPPVNVRNLAGAEYDRAKREMLDEGRQDTLRRMRDSNTAAAMARVEKRK